MSSNLVIVYHRQPYTEVEVDGKIEYHENKSPNGIVPTLKSFFGHVDKGAWIAWKEAEDPSNPTFERTIEIMSARWAILTILSENWIPGSLVAIGSNSPFAADASGLGSQVSIWLGAPASQTRMQAFAFARREPSAPERRCRRK